MPAKKSPQTAKKSPPISTTGTLSPEVSQAMEKYMPYMAEAQKKLLQVIIIMFVSAVIGGFNYRSILTFVMSRFDLTGINVVLTSPYQVIELAVQTGLSVGLVVGTPALIYNLITFLKPALEPDEFSTIISLLPISLILFISGFGFGIWIMNFVITIFTKASLDFSVGNFWDISRFFSQILFSALLMGLVFQFPVILTGLLRFNIITRKYLIKHRPYVYAACLIFAAALPPTDVFSLALMVFPLFILFEATLFFNRSLPEKITVAN